MCQMITDGVHLVINELNLSKNFSKAMNGLGLLPIGLPDGEAPGAEEVGLRAMGPGAGIGEPEAASRKWHRSRNHEIDAKHNLD